MSYYVFNWSESKSDTISRKASGIGAEVIAPQVSKQRLTGRDRKYRWVSEPAWPNYVIFGIEPECMPLLFGLDASLSPMWATACGPEQRPAVLPIREIERIRSERIFKTAGDMLKATRPDKHWTAGDLIRTLGGAYTGFEGEVVGVGAKGVQVDLEGWPCSIWVDSELIEAA